MNFFYLLVVVLISPFTHAASKPSMNNSEAVKINTEIKNSVNQHNIMQNRPEEINQKIATAYSLSPKDRLSQEQKASEAKSKALAKYEKKNGKF